VRPPQIKVSPDHVLTISGERKSESKQEEGGLVRMERSYGSFFRSFRLPDNVDLEGIKAEINKGELQLRIPKTEVQEETKEIEIPVEGK
jgi:HSP20 family protein